MCQGSSPRLQCYVWGVVKSIQDFYTEGETLRLVDVEGLEGGTGLVLQVAVVHAKFLDFTKG